MANTALIHAVVPEVEEPPKSRSRGAASPVPIPVPADVSPPQIVAQDDERHHESGSRYIADHQQQSYTGARPARPGAPLPARGPTFCACDLGSFALAATAHLGRSGRSSTMAQRWRAQLLLTHDGSESKAGAS